MLLCGLCVNSPNILFWDLRGFLPFCLSSGDPGISQCVEGQRRFVYRKERRREGVGRCGPECACILNCPFERRDGPGCYTNCTLKRWVKAPTAVPVTSEPQMKCQTNTTACNINRAFTPLPRTASDLGPAPRAVGWCCYCCFSCREQESRPKRTPVAITRPGGPLIHSTQGFIGTGSTNNDVCGQSTTNLLRGGMGDQPETVLFLCLPPESLSLLDNHLCSLPLVSSATTRGHMEMLGLSNKYTRSLWLISVVNIIKCRENTDHLNRHEMHQTHIMWDWEFIDHMCILIVHQHKLEV